MSVINTSVKTPDSVSFDVFEKPPVGMFPATNSEPFVGTSLIAVAAVGLGPQVGISPAKAETDSVHVKVSAANIRLIVVTPV